MPNESGHRPSYEDHSSSGSSTVGEEKQFLLATNPLYNAPKRRAGYAWKTIAVAFNIILFLTGLSVWGQAYMLLKTRNAACESKTAAWNDFEEDLLFNSRVTFQPRWPLVAPPTNDTNELWDRFSPPGEGVVELANEATIGLPPSRSSDKRPNTHKVYGISMFHQMHCVNLLRLNFYPDVLKQVFPDATDETNLLHRDHCIDYLQQVVMCHGDVTFEPWTEHGINGMGAIHECRDYEKIFTWAYEQRYDREKDLF